MPRKLNIPKDKQIQGLRKAIANPKTPQQFIPSMKKRLAKLLGAIALLATLGAIPARAQYIGNVGIQTTQQTLAPAGTACTGILQTFTTSNLGQTQHYATVTPSNVTLMQVGIIGLDAAGNSTQISDTIQPALNNNGSATVAGSGYFPKTVVNVVCTGGTFTLTYSGTSATSNLTTGGYQTGLIVKTLFGSAASQGSNLIALTALTPFGSSEGKIIFKYNTAAVTGSTLSVQCTSNGATFPLSVGWVFPLANNTNLQTFAVPAMECPLFTATYTSGGASANTLIGDYIFDELGQNSLTATAPNLTSALNLGPALSEKGARWSQVSTPAAGSQGTASKAAGAAGVRHVADCVTWSAGSIAAPAATQLVINLRDGASGAGTILWQTTLTTTTTAGAAGNGFLCGLNLIGSSATAMTLEFSALLANESESVTLTGYDVQ